jgi:hypothetical protein
MKVKAKIEMLHNPSKIQNITKKWHFSMLRNRSCSIFFALEQLQNSSKNFTSNPPKIGRPGPPDAFRQSAISL